MKPGGKAVNNQKSSIQMTMECKRPTGERTSEDLKEIGELEVSRWGTARFPKGKKDLDAQRNESLVVRKITVNKTSA